VSLALYRRYRPETFEEVIGQDHVTRPLQRALQNQRVNHAYLFSGPRGCGKTTSARILARCLNCEQGPTPTPCGVCRSCTDLGRGGPGSIDVIEIDAASHGGVDDARDLRERAFFAPVSARYKIYILDEAHMVSQAGFNALLKVVEEPPPHLKFIFATTEPEKVLGTIRSRTHHYPFRLVPPGVLRDYLAEVCERESVQVDPDVLPLVVRAGAGSVRDSMSVLDQLLAGAADDGVTYQMAVALLGYTDAALLDEAVSAFATRDGAAAFQAVDHVIEGGHDPRRFLADLLERLRDLVILSAVPDAEEKGLITVPGDQFARMREQAAAFGPADLSRAADLVNAGLLEMRGATAPRLLLELVCARVLLPSADDSVYGVAARLDRLERNGVGLERGVGATVGTSATAGPAGTPASQTPAEPNGAARIQAQAAEARTERAVTPPWRRSADSVVAGPVEAESQGVAEADAGIVAQDAAAQHVRRGGGTTDPATVRQLWPQVLEAVARRSRVAWAMVSQSVHVVGVEGRLLQLGFNNPNLRDSFPGSVREEVVREALREITGVEWKIDALVDPSAGIGVRTAHQPGQGMTTGATTGPGPTNHASLQPRSPAQSPPASAVTGPDGGRGRGTVPDPSAGGPVQSGGASSYGSAESSSPGTPPPLAQQPGPTEEDEPDPDDEDVEDAGPTARDLLVRELGATVVEEISDAD
jgi:DNA polymerase-3 subunit gamma/tau